MERCASSCHTFPLRRAVGCIYVNTRKTIIIDRWKHIILYTCVTGVSLFALRRPRDFTLPASRREPCAVPGISDVGPSHKKEGLPLGSVILYWYFFPSRPRNGNRFPQNYYDPVIMVVTTTHCCHSSLSRLNMCDRRVD